MALQIDRYLDSAVNWYSTVHDVDSNLAVAVIMQESGGDPDIVGDNGHSIGLMQLHDEGAGHGLTVQQRRDPATNLNYGCAYLAVCKEATGSWSAALVAYNAGVVGWEQMGRPQESSYSKTVMAIYARIQREGYSVVDYPGGALRWV